MTSSSSWQALSDCVGCAAPEVFRRLVRFLPQVATVSIATYRHLPLIQHRFIPTDAERVVIDAALRVRSDLGLPFWDAVMLKAPGSLEPLKQLFDAATTHLPLRGHDRVLSREEVVQGALEKICQDEATEGTQTAVLSEVKLLDGSVQHFEFMDFHIRPENNGLSFVREVCGGIFRSGAVILESGESFHAYGLSLLTSNEFMPFLGRALLYAPIVDRAYIAHQLIEQRCALRVSGGRYGEKPNPVAVEVF